MERFGLGPEDQPVPPPATMGRHKISSRNFLFQPHFPKAEGDGGGRIARGDLKKKEKYFQTARGENPSIQIIKYLKCPKVLF